MSATTVTYNNKLGSLGGPVSFRRAGVSRFCLPDMQGHIRQLADINGNITDTFTPDAWGIQKAATGSTVNSYKAFGKWGYFTDTPSRQYVRARELAPIEGKFLSRDPFRDQSPFGPYLYARNAPVVNVDPSGLMSLELRLAWVDPFGSDKQCCGKYLATWDVFGGNGPPGAKAPCPGYVIQHVTIDYHCTSCGKECPTPLEKEYWEALPGCSKKDPDKCKPFRKGQRIVANDNFGSGGVPKTYGDVFQWGEIKFICLSRIGLKPGQTLCDAPGAEPFAAAGGCGFRKQPSWWPGGSDDNSSPATHFALSNWNCCCDDTSKWSNFSFADPFDWDRWVGTCSNPFK